MCGTILVARSLYLEQEVRNDEGKGRQLATGAGVVARPGLVARAGDRRLLTGAASLVRIFLLPTKGYLGERRELTSENTPYFWAVRFGRPNTKGPEPLRVRVRTLATDAVTSFSERSLQS